MNFHHLGIATKDIDKTLNWLQNSMEVISFSKKVYDQEQDAYLQMIHTKDVDIELISGKVVEKFIQKNITYYHICYEVSDLNKAITQFENSLVISKPKNAILFDHRKVAFLLTPIGIVELLESSKER
jgi:methylmalonyl-CoA/ethylmalonyl-CoA epimerase